MQDQHPSHRARENPVTAHHDVGSAEKRTRPENEWPVVKGGSPAAATLYDVRRYLSDRYSGMNSSSGLGVKPIDDESFVEFSPMTVAVGW